MREFFQESRFNWNILNSGMIPQMTKNIQSGRILTGFAGIPYESKQ